MLTQSQRRFRTPSAYRLTFKRFAGTDTKKKVRYIYFTPAVAQWAILKFDEGQLPAPFKLHLRAGQIIAMSTKTPEQKEALKKEALKKDWRKKHSPAAKAKAAKKAAAKAAAAKKRTPKVISTEDRKGAVPTHRRRSSPADHDRRPSPHIRTESVRARMKKRAGRIGSWAFGLGILALAFIQVDLAERQHDWRAAAVNYGLFYINVWTICTIVKTEERVAAWNRIR